MNKNFNKLKRDFQPMTDSIKQALEERNLMDDYLNRPSYQQNDYLWWINEAKRQETKEKRLKQMLDELDKGGVYMKMDHPASRK